MAKALGMTLAQAQMKRQRNFHKAHKSASNVTAWLEVKVNDNREELTLVNKGDDMERLAQLIVKENDLNIKDKDVIYKEIVKQLNCVKAC